MTKASGGVRVHVRQAFTLNRNQSDIEAAAKRGVTLTPEQSFAPGVHVIDSTDADHWFVKAHLSELPTAGASLEGLPLDDVMRRAESANVRPEPGESFADICRRIAEAEAAPAHPGPKTTAQPDPKPADAGPLAQGDPQRGGLEHPAPPPPPGTLTTGELGVNPIGFDNAGAPLAATPAPAVGQAAQDAKEAAKGSTKSK